MRVPVYPTTPDEIMERWLASATDGLVSEAAERERAELAGHFRDAANFHVEQGETESAAAALAIVDLGDPREVNTRLKKTCLTLKDLKSIKERDKKARAVFINAFVNLLFLATIVLATWGETLKQYVQNIKHESIMPLMLSINGYALMFSLAAWVNLRLRAQVRFRLCMILCILARFMGYVLGLAPIVACMFFLWNKNHVHLWRASFIGMSFLLAMSPFAVAINELREWRLDKKLRREEIDKEQAMRANHANDSAVTEAK